MSNAADATANLINMLRVAADVAPGGAVGDAAQQAMNVNDIVQQAKGRAAEIQARSNQMAELAKQTKDAKLDKKAKLLAKTKRPGKAKPVRPAVDLAIELRERLLDRYSLRHVMKGRQREIGLDAWRWDR